MPHSSLHTLPSSEALAALPDGDSVMTIATAVAEAGGWSVLVGGFVRDALRGRLSKDWDLEVHDLEAERLEELLARFGRVHSVGRSFGVLRVAGIDADISLPRRDSKTAPGHKGFAIEVDPHLGFLEAARRRDLTVNSMGWDPVREELHDPHGGRADLERGVLRATDPASFAEDPLRGLRVVQLAARLEMEPDEELIALCSRLDLSELPGERIFEELRKLLLKADRPSLGLRWLRRSEQLRFFPELAALVGVPQEPEWHPEGDVWVHTEMVLDAAAALRSGDVRDDLALMLGALCHDLGKATVTAEERGRVRSLGHDRAGVPLTEAWLARLRAPSELTARCAALVRHHLAPALLDAQGSGDRAYRRLARRLGEDDVSLELLERVARADHLGRTTEDALAGRFEAGDRFLARARELAIAAEPPQDRVQGRHLIERGLAPGPSFGRILNACRELQDEDGESDPNRLLDRVLSRLDSMEPDGD